jgi:hypothetical protein
VYDVVTAELDHGRRIRALRITLPPHAVLFGTSAAWVRGARLQQPQSPVHVRLPDHERVRRRAALVVHCDALRETDVRGTRFGPATTPASTAFDLARSLPGREAVQWVDALLRATGTPVVEVAAVAEQRPGVRG